MRDLHMSTGMRGRYSRSLDLEGNAIMVRSSIRVRQKTIARLNPKDDATIRYKMETERRLVSTRTQDDWWRVLMSITHSSGYSLTTLKSSSRLSEIVEVRQAMWFISYYFHKTTLSELGRFFNKDHVTVRHGLVKFSTMLGGLYPDQKIMSRMNHLLEGLLNEDLIVSKEFYMKKRYS